MAFTYFISDLHLSAEQSEITDCFVRFLQDDAPQGDALYILGDLFEYWLGDDDLNPFTLFIAAQLRQLSEHCPIYFIHGNRDFALGQRYAQRAGMQILPAQSVIDLYGRSVLICHGDEFCTADHAYMAFRRRARSWWFKPLVGSLPLSWRRKLAQRGRQVSSKNKMQLSDQIMDVTPSEITRIMQHYQVDWMIHGHTHRPAIHQEASVSATAKRFVLGDWYTQGSILLVASNEYNLLQRPFQ